MVLTVSVILSRVFGGEDAILWGSQRGGSLKAGGTGGGGLEWLVGCVAVTGTLLKSIGSWLGGLIGGWRGDSG